MRIMGVDYGDARTGVAISDETQFVAVALTTINERDIVKTAAQIIEIYNTQGAGKIVLGLPRNMDGSLGFRADKTMGFKAELEQYIDADKIELWDERMTTLAARQYMNITQMSSKKRKKVVDAMAAEIILQGYLDSKRREQRD